METVDGKVILTEDEYRSLRRKLRSYESKMSTSKKILVTIWTLTSMLILISVYAFLFTDKDISGLATLAGVMTTAAAADTGFYSWKAKAENKVKITMSMVKDLADEYGIESVISIAGITLGE